MSFTKVIIEHNFHENKTEIVYRAKTFKELWDSPEFYSIDDGVSCRFIFVLFFLRLLKTTGTFNLYLRWLLKRGLPLGDVDEWEYESLTGKPAPKIKKRISNTPKVGIRYTHYNRKINFMTLGRNKKRLAHTCYESNEPGVIYIINKYGFYFLKITHLLHPFLEILARKMAFYKRISVYELNGYRIESSSEQEV